MKPGPLCHLCPLKDSAGPIWGTGSPHASLVIIGQNPGQLEIEKGEPFIGPSGHTLNNALRKANFNRAAAFTTNVVKCFTPPQTQIPQKAIECCRPLLDQEFDNLPKKLAYLAVGAVSFGALTGKRLVSVTNKKDPNAWLRGAVFEIGQKVIIPSMHPAWLGQTQFRDLPFFEADVLKAVRWSLGLGVRYNTWMDYNPTADTVVNYVEKCIANGDFALDVEYAMKTKAEGEDELEIEEHPDLTVIGISTAIGETLGVPPSLFSLLDPLFRKGLTMYTFNHGHELRCLSKYFGELNIKGFDLMLALNLLYSDAQKKDLGLAMSLFTDMPFTKNLSRSKPDYYNWADTTGTLWGGRNAVLELRRMGLEDVFWKSEMPLIPLVEEMRTEGVRCDTRKAMQMELECYESLTQYENFWREVLPAIDWTQNKELLAIFQSKGYPTQYRLRKDRATGRKHKTPTIDEDALELYRDKYSDELANLILLMRKLKKAADFTRIYSSDDRMHAQYMIHRQKAGRLQAKDPDVQNIPETIINIHPREILIPDDDDSVFVGADYEAAEFFTYGYAARCPEIMEIKKRGEYIHGIMFETLFEKLFFQEGMPKKKQFRLAGIHPQDLLAAKTGPLGMLYGRGWYSLYQDVNLKMSKDKSQAIFAAFRSRFPEVFIYHDEQRLFARRNGYVRNYFGRIRRIPHTIALENELLSFTGQSNVADIFKRKALLSFAEKLRDFENAHIRIAVHDFVMCSCPKKAARGVAQLMQDCMEATIPEMPGHWLTCVPKIGPNWFAMQDAAEWRP